MNAEFFLDNFGLGAEDYDEDEEVDENIDIVEEDDSDIDVESVFIDLVVKNSIVLDKQQTPVIKNKKNEAWDKIQEEFSTKHGLNFTILQLKKKLDNKKQSIKTKTDLNKTGNQKIKLEASEEKLYDLMGSKDNPSLTRTPGNYIVLANVFLIFRLIYIIFCLCFIHFLGAVVAGFGKRKLTNATDEVTSKKLKPEEASTSSAFKKTNTKAVTTPEASEKQKRVNVINNKLIKKSGFSFPEVTLCIYSLH